MNKHETSVQAVIMRLKTFATIHQDKIKIIKALPKAFEELFVIGDNIEKKIGSQKANIKGMTKEKKEIKKQLAEETVIIAGALYNYALKEGNIPLSTEMDISPSQITKLKDEIILPFVTKIYVSAKENLVKLDDYGIDQNKLDVYQLLITSFNNKKQSPKTGISVKHSQTAALDKLTKSAKKIIDKKLDKMMLQFKKTDTEMYDYYISTSKIEKTGSKKNNQPPADENGIAKSA